MNFLQKNYTLQVNYVPSDCLSFHSATVPGKNPTAMTPQFFLDSMSTHPDSQNDWHSPQKIKSTKESFTQYFITLPRQNKLIQKTNLSLFVRHKTLDY